MENPSSPIEVILTGPLGATRLAMSETADGLIDQRLPDRTDASKPKEMVRIERFVEAEFKRRKCSSEVHSAERFEIFQESFQAVIRTFKSWSPLLLTIQREYDEYVSKLRKDAEQLGFLQNHLQELQKDYELKYRLLRSEADKALEGERMRTTATITSLSQDLNKSL
eukprot:CAMPEP_0172209594 /NCGR_PEP_ID=MMETSP1050-20130122/35224_1 /TAXON_ID=233186 /ORGANISM="Cryptomonas curvata, Strain CCAP979/52" /LENGTH=166 /DNA_ID=CAMNT_0012889533 /DNA_START=54 /DNA_END=550 /DNA_ORIENTATION=+